MKVRMISYLLTPSISTLIFPNFQVMHVSPIINTAYKHCCLRAPVRISPLKSSLIKLDFIFSSHSPNIVCSILKLIRDLVFVKEFCSIQKREWKIKKSVLFHSENQIIIMQEVVMLLQKMAIFITVKPPNSGHPKQWTCLKYRPKC